MEHGRKVRDTRRRRELAPPVPLTEHLPDNIAYRFDNLIQRYEEPSSMVRWDAPLFTVPWNEELAPVEEIWQAITMGVLKPPNAGTSSVVVRSQT